MSKNTLRIRVQDIDDFDWLVNEYRIGPIFRDNTSEPMTDFLWFITKLNDIPVVFSKVCKPEEANRYINEKSRGVILADLVVF